jgi:hypothetical protein
MMGEGDLIWCFDSYLSWCDNLRWPTLIGRHKGPGLHQVCKEVILFLHLMDPSVIENNFYKDLAQIKSFVPSIKR